MKLKQILCGVLTSAMIFTSSGYLFAQENKTIIENNNQRIITGGNLFINETKLEDLNNLIEIKIERADGEMLVYRFIDLFEEYIDIDMDEVKITSNYLTKSDSIEDITNIDTFELKKRI